jgi:uncharacterized protein YegL
MAGKPIEALNEGLITFQESLKEDELAAQRVEVAIVTFGAGVDVIQNFVCADQFEAPKLQTSGTTPMGEAINRALDLLKERKKIYRENEIAYYRPWLFLITDGTPTDEWEPAAQRIKKEVDNGEVAFFAVGVQDADMKKLAEISPRTPIKLNGLKFKELFIWLSKSTQQASYSKLGDQTPLPKVTDWSTV